MAIVNQTLLNKLQKELGLRRSRVYQLIERKMAETNLDRHLAAIALASALGINTAKYASSEDRATIRGASIRPAATPFSPSAPIAKRVVKQPEPITLDLSFVSSKELQAILERDVAELNAALSVGLERTAKICMVLCGSIVEALLLDRLSQHQAAALAEAATLPKRPKPNLEDWELHEMVTVATRLGLLPEDASTGANQLRQWRNLIHPGRELKDARNKRISPTKARARNSIAYLQLVADELRP